ncbi:MAG: ATP-binding cassette domain-containing protein [Candidatus Zixiibacteriota bacterium]|nr:MAG: ATP-binding cassette domain-containing protein [candidate division Zixibacteria bacterium]
MLTLQNITYRFATASHPCLDDINLRVGRGERVCIMGPNGSGKSTLALIMAGLAGGFEGSREVRCARGASPTVGVLFQNPDDQMVATMVDKELAFGLENLAVPVASMHADVRAAARSFDLDHLLGRLTAELSGGEKQRVLLASLMTLRPDLLILDEPDSYLDVAGRRTLEKELARLRSERPEMTEIRITQFASVALTYPRLLLMDSGRIRADDAPHVLLSERGIDSSFGSLRTGGEQYASAPSVIRLKQVSLEYVAGSPVLEGLNFSLSRGETVAVVGPTGAGKSSLGHLVCGVLEPTLGQVEFLDKKGLPLGSKSATGSVVGLFQFPEHQFFLPDCRQELEFGPANLGRSLSDEQFRTTMSQVGLDPDRFASRDPLTLSMGEKRRLAFAVMLALSPSFVVFDEPTCGLDSEGVKAFASLSLSLKAAGVGQILVSHEADLVRDLSDRVLLMEQGGSASEMTTDEFLARRDCGDLVAVASGLVYSFT